MSPKERQAGESGASLRRAVVLTAILSVAATLVAVGALAVALTRGTGAEQAAQADPNACRTVTWDALPDAAALPPGWSIASSRFLVDTVTTSLVGPAPSAPAQAPAAFVSVTCYGNDAALALARDHEAALGAGATDVSFPKLGDETVAITSTRTGGTTVYVRRGSLVADITASTSGDPAALQAVAEAVDAAMIRALSASPGPSAVGVGPSATPPTVAPPVKSAAASPPASPGSSASGGPAPVSSSSPSASAAAASHVSPDLEALLPHSVGGTTLSSQSVLGSTALRSDATSQALIASLKKLGKTPADLEIAEAYDAAGKLPMRLFGFRVKGVAGSDIAAAIVDSWMAATAGSPVRSDVTIGGQKLTKVAYAQGGADYVYATGDTVFDIETTDETLVSKVLALLK